MESLVFRDKISCRWVRRVSSNKGRKERHPTEKKRYFAAIGRSGVKRLQIGTDMLLIITSTGNKLLRNVNIVDLE